MVEAIIAIAVGVVVYFLGRLFTALFVEPIIGQRRLISEIAESLVFYANVYCNPRVENQQILDDASEDARVVFRRQASRLRGCVHAVWRYSLWERMGLVREKRRIEEAHSELIGLANSVRGDPELGPVKSAMANSSRRDRIEKLLGIVRDEE